MDTTHKWEATTNNLVIISNKGTLLKITHLKAIHHKDKGATHQVEAIHHSQVMWVDQDPHRQALTQSFGAGFRYKMTYLGVFDFT